MTFHFEDETNYSLNIDCKDIIEKVIKESLNFEKCPYDIEVSVILTDNDGIWEINREYRKIDRPTDVLSFPFIEYAIPGDFSNLETMAEDYFNPDTGELMLGDIVISADKVIEQSKNYGHSIQRELAFLTAHSMLHLFGYDHMEENQRLVMETRQEKILIHLGITR